MCVYVCVCVCACVCVCVHLCVCAVHVCGAFVCVCTHVYMCMGMDVVGACFMPSVEREIKIHVSTHSMCTGMDHTPIPHT